MASISASEVSLSSLSPTSLWRESGRLGKRTDDFFLLADRHKTPFLLAPTHEEEITTLVKGAVRSHRDLPLRLYQISRKYRDEARPRQGLLRGREFVMKDLYTFDVDESRARRTYDEVRGAYKAFLDELRVPYLVAEADSGNMGGSTSHEYHFESDAGEDTVVSCKGCGYTANEEVAILRHGGEKVETERAVWYGTTSERDILVRAEYPKIVDGELDNKVNVAAVKAALPGLAISTAIEDPRQLLDQSPGIKQISLVDPRLHADSSVPVKAKTPTLDGEPILLTSPTEGTACPVCSTGLLSVHTAVEIGHTFHLGTRYSKPLGAQIQIANGKAADIQMGCHGIGVSRLIGALADKLADDKGLNWPALVAPFSVLAVYSEPNRTAAEYACRDMLQSLCKHDQLLGKTDIALDDRDKTVGWKLFDADLIGYPIIVVFGNRFASEGVVEVQCRRLEVKEQVKSADLAGRVRALLEQL